MAVRLVLATLVIAALAAMPEPASACGDDPWPAQRFEPASGVQALVQEAPPPPAQVRAAVRHGEAEESGDFCGGTSKCGLGDYDAVVLSVTPPEGVDPESIGYRVSVIEGTPPAELDVEGDFAAEFGADLAFFGAGPDPIELVLAVATLDRFGNASAPVHVAVSDSGRPTPGDSGGCSAATSAASPWLLALGALVRLRRRVARG